MYDIQTVRLKLQKLAVFCHSGHALIFQNKDLKLVSVRLAYSCSGRSIACVI